ncbi:MAG: hypothetical protein JSU04_15945 [Bdellovibrionales bacterium]|nr:hypothetical protein [Bdellovibrionales bacterium]
MVLGMTAERWMACGFLILGFSLFYFGFFRPDWFSKKAKNQKPSFKDESYFWQVFPYGLFFTIAGLTFITQPSASSLMVAFFCFAWVKILYKFV